MINCTFNQGILYYCLSKYAQENNMHYVATSGRDIEIQFSNVVKRVEKLCDLW